MDLVPTGVSTDSAEGLLVDPGEGAGTSVDLEESRTTLAFFLFFSKAMQDKVSKVARRRVREGRNTCGNRVLHVIDDLLRLLNVFVVVQPPFLVLTGFSIFRDSQFLLEGFQLCLLSLSFGLLPDRLTLDVIGKSKMRSGSEFPQQQERRTS